MEHLDPLQSLTSINLSNNRLNDIRGLVCLRQLVEVNLQGNNIGWDAVGAMAALPHLQHLTLSGNPVARDPMYRAGIAHMCPQLQTLDGVAVAVAVAEQGRRSPRVRDPSTTPRGDASTGTGSDRHDTVPPAVASLHTGSGTDSRPPAWPVRPSSTAASDESNAGRIAHTRAGGPMHVQQHPLTRSPVAWSQHAPDSRGDGTATAPPAWPAPSHGHGDGTLAHAAPPELATTAYPGPSGSSAVTAPFTASFPPFPSARAPAAGAWDRAGRDAGSRRPSTTDQVTLLTAQLQSMQEVS